MTDDLPHAVDVARLKRAISETARLHEEGVRALAVTRLLLAERRALLLDLRRTITESQR
ncbi:hypothetical protein [Methylobacterium sp. A54F]